MKKCITYHSIADILIHTFRKHYKFFESYCAFDPFRRTDLIHGGKLNVGNSSSENKCAINSIFN